jgi:predicted transcriptional regulator
MPADLRLMPELYHVLERVPAMWWNEAEAVDAIATVLGQRAGTVTKRITYLVYVGFVERRKGPTITREREIRRVGRE